MSYEDLRKRMDDIDEKFVSLFVERIKLSAKVAEERKSTGTPVLSGKREREILSRISENAGEEFEGYARLLYNTLFDIFTTSALELGLTRSSTTGLPCP